jgi:Tfp pilus assembly protein PilP
MKLKTSVLILALTGVALAQAPAKKPATGPSATKQSVSTATTHAAPVKSAKAAAKPVKKVASKKVAEAQAKSATTANPPAEQKKEAETKLSLKNRRDPFVSVVVSHEGGPPCAGGGKKCIAIDQITLQGVVRSPSGPIAVVSSGARTTYFLRENDPVYNGVVVKISPDSIIFRETIMDRLGKSSQREVVKRIPSSPAA